MSNSIKLPNSITELETLGRKISIKNGYTILDSAESYEGAYNATPTKTEQIFSTKNKLMSDNFKVKAIPEDYVIPGGNVTITSNGTHDVRGKSEAIVNVPIPEGYILGTTKTQAEYNALVESGGVDNNTLYVILAE